jgi:hypothetical protein
MTPSWILVAAAGGKKLDCGLMGSAGGPLAVFIKVQGGRWHGAFDSGLAVLGHEWWKHKGKDRLLLWLHGNYCNGYGIAECWSAQELKGLNFEEVKRHPDYKGEDSPFGDDGKSGGFPDQPGNPIRNVAPDNPLVNPKAKQ